MEKKNTEYEESEGGQPIEEDDFEDVEDDEEEEDIIDSSLEIGGQIHTQSRIIQNHPHLVKDVKYSNFQTLDSVNFIMRSKTYQLWQYIQKIEKISKNELNLLKKYRKELYDVKTLNDLKKHFEKIGKGHIWYGLMQLPPESLNFYFQKMLVQLDTAKNNGVLDIVYDDKEIFYDAYKDYSNTNKNVVHSEIDDFGLINTMMTLTEVKKASKGWATNSMNTTINVTKDENLADEVEEQPEDSERGVKGLFKK